VRDTIRQGFSWATREGPLCEEREWPPNPSSFFFLFVVCWCGVLKLASKHQGSGVIL
jgi:hypothetical protein